MTDPEPIVETVHDLSDAELHDVADVWSGRSRSNERSPQLTASPSSPMPSRTASGAMDWGFCPGWRGQHSVAQAVSYQVRDGMLYEVSQRNVTTVDMR